MGRIIGIDLGTTNSCAAFMDGTEPRLIPNDRGNRVTPSVVAFSGEGGVLVGEAAKNQAVINAEQTILEIKRSMGSERIFVVDGRSYSTEEISAFILKKLKRDAEGFLGEEVTEAVITVPAYFNEKQRRATIQAGVFAGLKVRRLINEPTAVALAYGIQTERNEKIVVYDLGGGTFDVTVLEMGEGVFEVCATMGNNHLGGTDFDNRLLARILDEVKKETGTDLTQDIVLLQMMREEVEKAKIELSSRKSAGITLPFIMQDGLPRHLSWDIKRVDFESLIEDFIDETMTLTEGAVREAGFSLENIDTLLLSGGSTRVPLVKEKLQRLAGIKPWKGINPEESVALGAAVQSSLIRGDLKGIILVDVTPYSLGVEIEGNQYIALIRRNSHIPVHIKRMFTTIARDQSSVEIHILQGEHTKASENISLGRFLLSGVRRAGKGVPRIEVNFELDVDGILHVSAQDLDTGVKQSVIISQEQDVINANSSVSAQGKKKNHLNSLVSRVKSLALSLDSGLEPEFRREIKEIIKKVNLAVISGTREELTECQVAMETILGELEAIEGTAEEQYEGA